MSELNIYNKLKKYISNDCGVCGLMGNIKAESGLKSTNLQNSGNRSLGITDEQYTLEVDNGTRSFVDNRGYGLCQWTSSGRKQALYNYVKQCGKSIGDEDAQIEFLLYELTTSYKGVFNVLLNATSVKEASDYVVKKFERPKNQSDSVLNKRANYGVEFYNKFVKEERKPISMIKPIDYKQGDSRWGSLKYAVDGENSTIKSAGCGITVMADIIATLVSPYITPITTASWSRMKGYKVKHSGTSYSYFVPQGKEYGLNIKRINTSNIYHQPNNSLHIKALDELKKGNWLIACMGKGHWTKSGHYILVYGYENGIVYIADPASNKADRLKNTWDLLKNEVKYYWSVDMSNRQKAIDGEYRQKDFVRECQFCLGAGLDGAAGNQTLSKTVTLSKSINKRHKVVIPVQNKLKKLGYYKNAIDGSIGNGMTNAINLYQKEVMKYKKLDGKITANGKMWKSLLGMKY